MDAHRRPRPADPDFDAPTAPSVRLRDFDPLDHQRLVVNPFLAILALVGLAYLTRKILESSTSTVPLVLVIPLVLVPRLVHFHCLDCGRTGLFRRRRDHACPRVMARWYACRRPWWPSSRVQLFAWCLAFAVAAFLVTLRAAGRGPE